MAVVIAHPESGRRALFVNPGYTVHVMGLARSESNAVLSFLFAHIGGADFQYRHHWSPGDLVLWDEVTVRTARPATSEPRTARRFAPPPGAASLTAEGAPASCTIATIASRTSVAVRHSLGTRAERRSVRRR